MLSPNKVHDCLLISVQTKNRDGLFDCYRDYIVFMGLVRDAVNCKQVKVYGFCWTEHHCLMLIQPMQSNLGQHLLRLLKRYHYWLLQRGPAATEFKLRILTMKDNSWTLDALRYLHQQVVYQKVAKDALDYHWHSYHAYHGFWSLNWLNTSYIFEQFSLNRVVAVNQFRQFMLHRHRLEFSQLLKTKDMSYKFLQQTKLPSQQPLVAEMNSQYHQSLIERTQIEIRRCESYQQITISVTQS